MNRYEAYFLYTTLYLVIAGAGCNLILLLIPIDRGRRSTVPLESRLAFREWVGIFAIVTLERFRLLLPDNDRNEALLQGLSRLARFQVYL